MNPSPEKKHISLLSMTALLRKGIRFCFQKLIAPHSHHEDDRRQEYIFNIIMSGFLTLIIIYGFSLIITYVQLGPTHYQVPIGIYTLIFCIFATLLILSRKGYVRFAMLSFIAIYFIIATYIAIVFGVELPMVLISYVIIIIMSSILVSTRFSIITTFIITGTLITLGYFQVSGITHPDTAWRTIPILLSDPIQLSVALALITLITWLSNKEIESSLIRARTSEQLLTLERDNLEQIVQDRTKEIKSLQAEKVAQLYRSAEFGRLSSGLFHDLMNPLTALIGNIDRMKSNPQDTLAVDTYLEKSIYASKRMGAFLGSIKKQISRHALLENFSCDLEIIEAVEVLNYKAREAGVTLRIHTLENITLYGNPLKFHQIAINLIANAIDAYLETNRSSAFVEISLSIHNAMLVLSVSDQGSGIPTDLITTIFDPFFTTKDPHHGTGLGLSTTKNIVESDFGGTIDVVSTHHIGTTFTVSLPIYFNN